MEGGAITAHTLPIGAFLANLRTLETHRQICRWDQSATRQGCNWADLHFTHSRPMIVILANLRTLKLRGNFAPGINLGPVPQIRGLLCHEHPLRPAPEQAPRHDKESAGDDGCQGCGRAI